MEDQREIQVTDGEKEPVLMRISFYLLIALGFISLIAFLPGLPLESGVLVGLLSSVFIGIVSVLYGIYLIVSGNIHIIKNPFFYTLLLTNIIFLVSALLSENIHNSLIGFGGQSSTFGFFFVASLFLFLTSLIFTTKDRIFSAYVLFFLAWSLVSLHHILRFIFGPDVLTFGVFNLISSSVLGGWYNLAIFFGAATLISLLTSEILRLSRNITYLVRGMLIVSLFFLIAVNFTPVWIVVGIFSLVLCIYTYIASKNKMAPSPDLPSLPKTSSWSYIALGTFILSFVFVVFGGVLYPPISKALGVSVVDVRPSWTATTEIAQQTLGEHFLLGSGPNTFSRQWVQYKPSEVNNTIFFATDFNAGIGFIPTLVATTGILGFLSMCAIVLSLLYAGFKIFSQPISDQFSRYLIISSFTLSVYLWIMLFVYTPSASMLLFSFFALGLFFAAANREGLLHTVYIPFSRHPRTSFITIVLIVFAVTISGAFAYGFAKSAFSRIFFAQSIEAASEGAGIAEIQAPLARAIAIEPHDTYFRSLADVGIFKMITLLQRDNEGEDPAAIEQEFQTYLSEAISAGEAAVRLDRNNYLNWQKLGEVYALVAGAPLSLSGAYENALESFNEADALNPESPVIPLLTARLHFSVNNIEEGRLLLNEAIARKDNYFEAHFLLSQVEALSGNLPEAIAAAERSAVLAPNDAGVFFQLGLLYYNNKDYNNAIRAFTRAVDIVPEYSNAMYFLALSLEKVGGREEAISLFEEILVLNPGNEEVLFILGNLRAGKPPFAEAPATIDPVPELGESLPLEN